ncbi:hypothetical protein Taro_011555 [Colocasia esculenta]|uniref:Ubiquitin-like protease family profile domain-containing protein n=1 Tax=Colocasia esculenta TaxID=4460 RepID=A0A843U1R0_COLES|nr:hypothetical protein [Colocasia esculenta]
MDASVSVQYVEPNEGEDDHSQNLTKMSKPSGPIASADILMAKKKDLGHWRLIILCHEEEDDLPFIMLLDFLHSTDPIKLVRPIQRFLKDIYTTKNKAVIVDAMSSVDILVPSVPQQSNHTECGFFVLSYIYRFIQNDPPPFSLDDFPSFIHLQNDHCFNHQPTAGYH